MALIQDALISIFKKRTITEPIFAKKFNKDNEQLNDLMELSKTVISD